jgi:hypothetical protein
VKQKYEYTKNVDEKLPLSSKSFWGSSLQIQFRQKCLHPPNWWGGNVLDMHSGCELSWNLSRSYSLFWGCPQSFQPNAGRVSKYALTVLFQILIHVFVNPSSYHSNTDGSRNISENKFPMPKFIYWEWELSRPISLICCDICMVVPKETT